MLVQPHERIERPVAQETLKRGPVPRAVCCPRHCRRRGFIATHGSREQAVRVGDVVVCVGADDEAVELLAGHAGRTGARLKV